MCPVVTATPGTCWGMDAEQLVAEQNKDIDLNIILAWLRDKATPSKGTLFLDSPTAKFYWIILLEQFTNENPGSEHVTCHVTNLNRQHPILEQNWMLSMANLHAKKTLKYRLTSKEISKKMD